jgi:hypothetical protein
MMNPTFRRLGKTGAMEVGAHSGAHFQLVGLNGREGSAGKVATRSKGEKSTPSA